MKAYEHLVDESVKKRMMEKKFIEIIKNHDYDLTISQFMVLSIVNENNICNVTDIALRLESSLAFITNTLQSLAKKGLITKTKKATHSEDLRHTYYEFTGDSDKLAEIDDAILKVMMD